MEDLLKSNDTIYYDAEQGSTISHNSFRDKDQFDDFQSLDKDTNRSININHNSTRIITSERLSTSSHIGNGYDSTMDQPRVSLAQQDITRHRKRKLLYALSVLIVIVVIVAVSITLILVLRARK